MEGEMGGGGRRRWLEGRVITMMEFYYQNESVSKVTFVTKYTG